VAHGGGKRCQAEGCTKPGHFKAGLHKFALFYYKQILLPDAAWKRNELVLLNKRLERHASCRGWLYKLNSVYP
jgi:hypothetical protein